MSYKPLALLSIATFATLTSVQANAKTILNYSIAGKVSSPNALMSNDSFSAAALLLNGVFCDTTVSMKTSEVSQGISGGSQSQNYHGQSRTSKSAFRQDAEFSGNVTINPERAQGNVQVDVVKTCFIVKGAAEIAAEKAIDALKARSARKNSQKPSPSKTEVSDNFQMPLTMSWTCQMPLSDFGGITNTNNVLSLRGCQGNQSALDAGLNNLGNSGMFAVMKNLLVRYLQEAQVTAEIKFTGSREIVENYNCSDESIKAGYAKNIRFKVEMKAGAKEDDFVLYYKIDGGLEMTKSSLNPIFEFDVAYCPASAHTNQIVIDAFAKELDAFSDDVYSPVKLRLPMVRDPRSPIVQQTMNRQVFWNWHAEKMGILKSYIRVELK